MATRYLVGILFLVGELSFANHADFTAGEVDLEPVDGIISFKITTLFPAANLQKWCLGTLVRRIELGDRCDYTVVTAGHCLIAEWKQGNGLVERALATSAEVEGFPYSRSYWIEVHPEFATQHEHRGAADGVDLGFFRFKSVCSDTGKPVMSLWSKSFPGIERISIASINNRMLIGAYARVNSNGTFQIKSVGPLGKAPWIMHGDSGGGCFLHRSNKEYLAGVVSYHEGSGGDYCSAPRALAWLQNKLASE
jgi:hypothetical protein